MVFASLDEVHGSLGAEWTTIDGRRVPAGYGDADAEYGAARTGTGLVDLGARGRLRVSGKDAPRFLHGMLTRSVTDLADGYGIHAALTTAQGQTLADMRLYRHGDVYTIETEPGLQEKVRQSLDRYLIADDVTLEDTTGTVISLGLTGAGAWTVLAGAADSLPEAWCAGLPASGPDYLTAAGALGETACTLVAYMRHGWARYDVQCAPDAGPAVWGALTASGARPVGWDAMEALRLEAGIPRYGVDVDERVMPLEAGLADAVDFDKGCFVGQEALAKMRNLGKPRRHLVGLLLDTEALPEAGSTVSLDGKEAGWVTSSSRSPGLGRNVAMASVRRGCHEPGQRLLLAAGSTAHVADFPLVVPGSPNTG